MTAINRIALWFASAWTTRARVDACAHEYTAIGRYTHVMADIALRGGVWKADEPHDALALAYAQGRRALALEIIELAEMDPRLLRALLDTPILKERRET